MASCCADGEKRVLELLVQSGSLEAPLGPSNLEEQYAALRAALEEWPLEEDDPVIDNPGRELDAGQDNGEQLLGPISSMIGQLNPTTEEEWTLPRQGAILEDTVSSESPEQGSQRPTLMTSREDARHRLESQMEKGAAIRDSTITSDSDFDRVEGQARDWHQYNVELLRNLFDQNSVARQYDVDSRSGFIAGDLRDNSAQMRRSTERKVAALQAIVETLDLRPVNDSERAMTRLNQQMPLNRKVFIVHGHDNEAKEITARLVSDLVMIPVILHEQPSMGRTIIEKFEDHSDVSFAIVLLTPDDLGGPFKEMWGKEPEEQVKKLRARARQNVVFELGFFSAKLGRGHVCALLKGEGIEIPSDYAGIVYIGMDPAGAWKLAVAREMRAAGLDVDLNRL